MPAVAVNAVAESDLPDLMVWLAEGRRITGNGRGWLIEVALFLGKPLSSNFVLKAVRDALPANTCSFLSQLVHLVGALASVCRKNPANCPVHIP